MYAALALLTDKMDTKYIIPSEAYESHDDAHPKKKHVSHLGFFKTTSDGVWGGDKSKLTCLHYMRG